MSDLTVTLLMAVCSHRFKNEDDARSMEYDSLSISLACFKISQHPEQSEAAPHLVTTLYLKLPTASTTCHSSQADRLLKYWSSLIIMPISSAISTNDLSTCNTGDRSDTGRLEHRGLNYGVNSHRRDTQLSIMRDSAETQQRMHQL